MARDSGVLTSAKAAALYADPTRSFTVASAVAATASSTITYTLTLPSGVSDLRKTISVGASVTVTGVVTGDIATYFSYFNFDDGALATAGASSGNLNSATGSKGVVSAVSTNTVTITSSAITSANLGGADRSVSPSAATLTQDSAVGNQPLDNAPTTTKNGTWLPTSGDNVAIDMVWGPQMARIQPDDDRTATVPISAAVANGIQIDFTSTSHSLSKGQYIDVTGITNAAGVYLDRVNTRYVIAATATDHIFVNSVVTGALVATNAAAVVLTPINGTQNVTAVTFSSSAATVQYTTSTPHGYVVGQQISVTGSSNEYYNLKNSVITTNDSTTLTVNSPSNPVTGVSVSSTTTYATYSVAGPHSFNPGDKVWITNITTNNSAIATTSSDATILSVTPTSFTVATGAAGITATPSNTFTIGATSKAIKALGSFTAPARLGQSDAAWGQAFVVPSGRLVTGQDNNEIAKSNLSGYPGYAPVYTYPNVVGSIQTADNPQAVRAFKAAGFTNVSALEYTNSTAGATISQVAYSGSAAVYTATAHGLVAGQTVTVPTVNLTTANGTLTGAGVTYNAVITTTAANTFTVASASASSTVTNLVGQWVATKGISISTVAAAATAAGSTVTVTTATPHGLKIGDKIGIAGTFSATGYTFGYIPGSPDTSTTVGTAVTGVSSPFVFTYAAPATLGNTTPGLTASTGLVMAYNGIAVGQVLATNGAAITGGSTNTVPSVGIIVNATPAPNGTGGGTAQSSYA
jgi:hypothetical protein